MIIELKRRGRRSNLLFFSILLLPILNIIARLWRCEHLYNLCKTPSGGSIFCKPAGPEYEKKKKGFSKSDVVLHCLFSQVPDFSMVSQELCVKKVKGKCETSRKGFDVIQPHSLDFFLLMLPSKVLFLDQWIILVIALQTFLLMICKSEQIE